MSAARTSAQRRRTRARAIAAWTAAALVSISTGFLVYASTPMMAEPEPLARAAEIVTITETGEGVMLTPDQPDGTGLVFFAGARVDAAAYAHTLSGIAKSGVTVVIARPALGFAIFESRPLRTWTARAPGVDSWMVGGHSLGGVRACMYAADASNPVSGLVLFGSYCSVDLSDTDLAVLSLAGENDRLSTPQKIADARHLLPGDAQFETIPGASHAQFGDYGVQPGDGPQEADDDDVREAITAAYAAFAR